MLMFVGEPADTAAAAQHVPSHGEGDAPVGVAIEAGAHSARVDACVDVGSWI